MSEQDFQEISKLLDKRTKECETFSNPIRALIASLILANKEMTWTEIKQTIEKISKTSINPNTLSFHLGKLEEVDYIEKVGTVEQPIYRIKTESIKKIVNYIDPAVMEILERRPKG
jgi:DNA-binding transcriptional ArsR family regulator